AVLGCDARGFSSGTAHGISQSLGGSSKGWLSSGTGVTRPGAWRAAGYWRGEEPAKAVLLARSPYRLHFCGDWRGIGVAGRSGTHRPLCDAVMARAAYCGVV